MRRSDLEKGGPHGLAPWGPLDTLWTFIKSKFSEEGSAEAVQLRNEWNAILRRWALEMEAQAGSCTGWVDGAEVIIDTLRYKAKSDAGIQWSEQQKTFYVGILFHAWADHDKKWQAAPEKNARKTVTEIDGGKFMRATKKELHQMTPANAPKEMPYCELTLGTTSSSASRQRAKSAGSASDAEDGDGADSASGWESDGAAKKRSPKKAKKAPAKQPAPAPDSLASLVNTVKKLHDKVSSNTAAFAKLGGKGGGDGGGGWQSKNSVLGANSAQGRVPARTRVASRRSSCRGARRAKCSAQASTRSSVSRRRSTSTRRSTPAASRTAASTPSSASTDVLREAATARWAGAATSTSARRMTRRTCRGSSRRFSSSATCRRSSTDGSRRA